MHLVSGSQLQVGWTEVRKCRLQIPLNLHEKEDWQSCFPTCDCHWNAQILVLCVVWLRTVWFDSDHKFCIRFSNLTTLSVAKCLECRPPSMCVCGHTGLSTQTSHWSKDCVVSDQFCCSLLAQFVTNALHCNVTRDTMLLHSWAFIEPMCLSCCEVEQKDGCIIGHHFCFNVSRTSQRSMECKFWTTKSLMQQVPLLC